MNSQQRKEQSEGIIAKLRKARGLGDAVEIAAKPIAKALRMKCLDGEGNLKPKSRCAKLRNKLNRKVAFSDERNDLANHHTAD